MIYLLIPIGLIILVIWGINSMLNQSKKDWKTLEDLEARVKLLKTKEEIEEFYKEFLIKAIKIDNRVISHRLQRVYGFIQGLYKPFQKD